MNRGWQVIYNSMNKKQRIEVIERSRADIIKKKKTLYRREMVGKAEDDFYFNIKCK